MKKPLKILFRSLLLICGLACLTQSTALEAYSFQEFKTAFRQTYPTWDTPLKDLKVMYNYVQKKLSFKSISPSESQAFWRAVKRTGLPATAIIALLTGGGIAGKHFWKKRQEAKASAPATEAEKKSNDLFDAIVTAAMKTKDMTAVSSLIKRKIGILGENFGGFATPLDIFIAQYSMGRINESSLPLLQKLIAQVQSELSSSKYKLYMNAALDFFTRNFHRPGTDYTKLYPLVEMLLKSGATPDESTIDHIFRSTGALIQHDQKIKPIIRLLMKYGAPILPRWEKFPIPQELEREKSVASLMFAHEKRRETATPHASKTDYEQLQQALDQRDYNTIVDMISAKNYGQDQLETIYATLSGKLFTAPPTEKKQIQNTLEIIRSIIQLQAGEGIATVPIDVMKEIARYVNPARPRVEVERRAGTDRLGPGASGVPEKDTGAGVAP